MILLFNKYYTVEQSLLQENKNKNASPQEMPLKPSFHISTLSLSLHVIGIRGLLDLLKGKPEANVPGDQAEAGGIKTLKQFVYQITK